MKSVHWIAAGIFLAVLLVFSGLAAERCFLAPPSITDDGARKIMIANVRENGSIFLRLPGTGLDPEGRFLPGGFHFRKTARGIVSFHAPYFSFLAAHLPMLCCGYAGVGLALLATFLMTFLLPLRRMRLPVILGFAVSSPAFYGPLCWEMPFAAAWGGFALLWLLEARERKDSWRFVLAGAALGAGLFLREEFYVLGAAAGLVLLQEGGEQRKHLPALAAGGFAAALLYWGCNGLLFGHILGIHGAAYHSNNAQPFSLLKILSNYWVFLFRFDLMPVLGAVLGLLAVLGSSGNFLFLRKTRIALLLTATGLWIMAAVRLYMTGTPLDFLHTISFAGANPLFVFFLGSWRALWNSPQLPVRFGTRLCVLYLLLTPALLSQNDMGIVWGSRHFFLIFPLTVSLSIYGAKHLLCRPWIARCVIAPVLAASAAFLFAGIFQRNLLQQSAARLDRALDQVRGPVVTDLFFLPEMTPHQALKRPFLSPHADGELLHLSKKLKTAGVRECTLVLSLSPQYRRISDRELAQFLREFPAMIPEKIQSPRTPMLDCWIIPCRRK